LRFDPQLSGAGWERRPAAVWGRVGKRTRSCQGPGGKEDPQLSRAGRERRPTAVRGRIGKKTHSKKLLWGKKEDDHCGHPLLCKVRG